MNWKYFYNIIIVPVLWIGFRVYALLNSKAKRSWYGRENLFDKLENNLSKHPKSSKRIWFHASSMGEFEQAKPIIAELKQKHPPVIIIVSFFSSSGYEHSLAYKLADVITYIPFDSAIGARKFVELVRPAAAVFMRYDIWPNHLWELNRRCIPSYIASATLHRKKYREIPVIRNFLRNIYNSIDFILTVSSEDKNNFSAFNLTHPVIELVGDTRYDQVWRRSSDSKLKQLLDPKIISGKKVIVVGSSWKEDEVQLLQAINRLIAEGMELVVILVPHEPTEENLDYLEKECNSKISNIRFSHLQNYNGESIIIVDSVGILMPLYQYADIAFVGGGFSAGIHNVLEPAVYGVPVVFGPKFANSQEAQILIAIGGATSVTTDQDVYELFSLLLKDENERERRGKKAFELVKSKTGATERFFNFLKL
ncbi:MAG: 3-deoxy-D-manno-octulosonic acid transferase [Ignavibacteriales bacterium]|nr:3-deoxy-D-manno-octulosonic acid transferase [Ignavibacteriales bacterium]